MPNILGMKTHRLAAAILADDAGNGRHECDLVVSVADVRPEAADAADLHRVDARHGEVRRVSRLVRIVISSKKRFKIQKKKCLKCVLVTKFQFQRRSFGESHV